MDNKAEIAPPQQQQQHQPFMPMLKWSFLDFLYDELMVLSGLGPTFKRRVTALAEPISPPSVILDVGCGTGTQLSILNRLYPDATVYGIEPDEKLVEKVLARFSEETVRVHVQYASGEKLPFDDNAIELCFSTLVLHHMPTEAKITTLSEVYRVLKPGGIFLLTDWGDTRVPSFLRWFLIVETYAYIQPHFEGIIPRIVQEAGFEIVSTVRVKRSGIWSWKLHKPSAVV